MVGEEKISCSLGFSHDDGVKLVCLELRQGTACITYLKAYLILLDCARVY